MNAKSRELQLGKQLREVLHGRRKILTSLEGQHFLEAACLSKSAGDTVQRIVTSSHGLEGLAQALRCDLSLRYVETYVVKLLLYLADPAVKALGESVFLSKILNEVVDPPAFWDKFVDYYVGKKLAQQAVEALAWLSLELVSKSPPPSPEILRSIRDNVGNGSLLEAQSPETRLYGYKLNKLLRLMAGTTHGRTRGAAGGPGGRHDNDFEDFRQVRILPTRDELLYKDMPYFRTADEIAEVPREDRPRAHLENQFRLLREDMLGEIRSDMQAIGTKRGRRTATVLGQLSLVDIAFSKHTNSKGRVSLKVVCETGLEKLLKVAPEKRRDFLRETKSFLKHQSFGAFCLGKELVAFGFIWKEEDGLLEKKPVVEIQLPHLDLLDKTIKVFYSGQKVDFLLVDTSVFAYEPVLNRLKEIKELPLDDCLLNPSTSTESGFEPNDKAKVYIEELKTGLDKVGGCKIGKHPVDAAQVQAILSALGNAVSVIQGPPGTGKSYVGALFVYLALQCDLRVLVLSYTNHALDQFLKDLCDIGISKSTMVRLGAKSTEATAPMLLDRQTPIYQASPQDRAAMNSLASEIEDTKMFLEDSLTHLLRKVESPQILEHLEFNDPQSYQELVVPTSDDDGFEVAGSSRGKTMGPGFLLEKWLNMKFPSPLKIPPLQGESARFWKMPRNQRHDLYWAWIEAVRTEQIAEIVAMGTSFSQTQASLESLRSQSKKRILRAKTVIGCTTTAGAMYQNLLTSANPDVVLVEEAGEILEAHVLAALAPSVSQLVLIGDHKQLRPKTSNYALSVEKGDGFDLNRSLFERLILKGHPFSTLTTQHRMHPDISHLARALTYPDLEDSPKAHNRKKPLGIRGRVVFVNHEQPEEDSAVLAERRDQGAPKSRQNMYEAAMVLKLVRYLGQQGYKTANMVVLCPYLAQLNQIRAGLSTDVDPQLTDLDSYELRRAGLITGAASKVGKQQLRISTVDNYQGEESDIVIVSLTRSNSRGDIGFLSSPERLNVLLTRAREAVIMIGRMDTFLKSKKGSELWTKFFNLLKERGSLHDGVPVQCQQHPGTTALLSSPEDFDRKCPDGGCDKPCDAPLRCGAHKCERRCHNLRDHSKVICTQIVHVVCSRGHNTKPRCGNKDKNCATCRREDDEVRRRAQRDLKLEAERRRKQAIYQLELDVIRDELDREKRLMKYKAEEADNEKTLEREKADLRQLRETRERMQKMKVEDEKRDARRASSMANMSGTPAAASPTSSAGDKGPPCPPQNATEEWAYMKRYEGQSSAALDELMKMVGLEAVKQVFLGTKSRVDTALRQGISLSKERFNCSLLGNPGTGKTTVARLYGAFLASVGVIPGIKFEEITGSKLATMGVQGCQDLLDKMLGGGGGVLFIDEAYQLTSGNSPGGKGVLDFLLAEVENLTGKMAFVLAGYNKQMESFFAHNPGLPSRFPVQMRFDDYTDDELLRILQLKVNDKFGGRMQANGGGLGGLYCRIVSRRVGRGRGREGFGNARDVENALVRIYNRQANRIRIERRATGPPPDDFLLTKEDIIGPEPSKAFGASEAWQALNELIGLAAVKSTVKALVDTMQANYRRELAEEPPIEYSLNKVFLGNPGTGKTTVAKIYGQILVELGLLSNGEVIVKNPSDFIGSHLGHSEQQTKGILAATVGKVLVIDEAYGLYGGGAAGNTTGDSNQFKTAVVDTMVAEVQSTPGEDRCVLLLGYQDQMEVMFQNVNPGLARRFPIASAFAFEDFTKGEMAKILDFKLKKAGYKTTGEGRRVALEVLERARSRPNFGNAGEIDILLDAAKGRHQKRLASGETDEHSLLEAVDFDPDFDRVDRSDTNVAMLFKETVGCDRLVSLLEGYQTQVRTLKRHGLDPRANIPFNFLFRGPPGTGKTTTARKMGKFFYDLGFLASAQVVETSATDLIGTYVGHTGPKVQKLLDKALGRILFVDEAYRLAQGPFAKEAVDELVDCVTKERYQKKLVIILAGYDDDINRLLSVNPGLSSRFPETIPFHSLAPEECLCLLEKKLQQEKRKFDKSPSASRLSLWPFGPVSLEFRGKLLVWFGRFAALKSWANARDVETLVQKIFRRVLKETPVSDAVLVVTEHMILDEISAMYDERHKRDAVNHTPANRFGKSNAYGPMQSQGPPAPPQQGPSIAAATMAAGPEAFKKDDEPKQQTQKRNPWKHALRDAGVSDEIWEQLELDRQAVVAHEKNYLSLKRKLQEEASEALREKILDELFAEEQRRKEEEDKQAKLAAMRVCPMGYAWIKQAEGYRCAGGAHYISNADII